MPPLSNAWLRSGRGDSTSWLQTPAQRAVRVLQVTRANWPVGSGGRRKKRRGGMGELALMSSGKESFAG